MNRTKAAWIASALVLGLLSSRPAIAGSCTWTGASGDDWFDSSNWTGCGFFHVPDGSDDASIPATGTNPRIGSGAASIFSLTIGTGAGLSITSGGQLVLGSGGLTGAGDLVVFTGGQLVWTGGTMDGSGSTTANAGSSVLLAGGDKILGRTMTLGGSATFFGLGSLTISPGTVLHNAGTLDVENDAGILGAGGQIDNTGTLQRSASGNIALIGPDVGNSGSVSVLKGTFSFTGNTTNTGTVSAASGATVSYDGGVNTFNGSVSGGIFAVSAGSALLSGPVTVESFSLTTGAPTVHVASSFSSSVALHVDTGHLFIDLSAAVFPLASLTVGPGATLTMTAFPPITANILDLSGTIEGNEDLVVTGSAIWDGGTMLGPGATRLTGPTTISGGVQNVGRDIDLQGTTIISGPGISMVSAAALIRVIGPATADSAFQGVFGGAGLFRILGSGSLNILPGGGPLSFESPVINDGTVSFGARSTSLGSYVQTSGSTVLSGGGGPIVLGSPMRIQGGTLSGEGVIQGDVVVSTGAGIAPGESPGAAGNLQITGNLTQSAPGHVSTDSSAPGGATTDLVSVGGSAALGGTLDFSTGFTPAASMAFNLLSYGQRFGSFRLGSLPALPAGLSWAPRYAAHGFSLLVQPLLPSGPLRIDAHAASAGGSNLNQVLEPGERVLVEPTWTNPTSGAIALDGVLFALTGPPGPIYTIEKADASYGTITPAASADCFTATGNCYEIALDVPATRPAAHWDVIADEGSSDGLQLASWTIHVGNSFNDVPSNTAPYRFVETLFHNLITSGCGGGAYCPSQPVTRAQMAVFLLKANFGASYLPPAASGGVFLDVPSNGFAAAYIENLAALGVTGGCGSGNYCPNDAVTRAQMAVFLLKTQGGVAYTPPPCGSAPFADVPCSSGFAPWIAELARRGITAGCGGGNYCPQSSVTRGQMAVFLTATFSLQLNGT